MYAVVKQKVQDLLPSIQTLTELFEQLYFASLQQEEGENVTCRVAFIDRENPDPTPPERIVKDRWQCHPFSGDLAFTTRNLVKLSKAVDPWTSTLAVYANASGELRIWGLVDQAVHQSTYINKESDSGPEIPGIFQASAEGVGEIAAYRGYAFLGRLRQNSLVTKELAALDYGPIHQKLSRTIRDFQAKARASVGDAEYLRRTHWNKSLSDEWLTTLSRILIGIKRYGHGGAVLLSGDSQDLTIRYNLQYTRLSEALDRIAVFSIMRCHYSDKISEQYLDTDAKKHSLPISLYLNERVAENDIDETENEITGCVRFLSSLSRVDGLLWLNRNLTLQGFGVLIQSPDVQEKVFRAEDAHGKILTEIDIRNFGTRHRSMMRKCHQDINAVGFVVSQDGDVRAITSDDHKVIIWENIRLHRLVNVISAQRAVSEEDSSE